MKSPLTIPTALHGVELRSLTPEDAAALFDLLQRNREFLTRCGDYLPQVNASLEATRAEMIELPEDSLAMGVWQGGDLLGRVDLRQVEPGNWVLGYWLAENYTGRGIMSAACRALLGYARQAYRVEAFWAGVRHANTASAALVERLGFTLFESLADHRRYRLVAD